MSAPGVERRREGRGEVRCPARLRIPAMGTIYATVLNVSTMGLLVASPVDVPLGIEIRITVELPDGEPPLDLVGMAVRKNPDGTGCQAGFCLMSPPESARRRLQAVVYAAPPV